VRDLMKRLADDTLFEDHVLVGEERARGSDPVEKKERFTTINRPFCRLYLTHNSKVSSSIDNVDFFFLSFLERNTR